MSILNSNNPVPQAEPEHQRYRLGSPLPPGLRWVLVTVGYLVLLGALKRCTLTFRTPQGVTPWYPPPGLSLALLLAFGLRYTPALLLGIVLTDVVVTTPHLPSPLWTIAIILIKTAVYTLAALFLRRAVQIDQRLRQVRDVAWFALAALAAPLLLAASIGALLAAAGSIPWSDYGLTVLTFWIGDAIGTVTLTPFLLTWALPRVRQVLRNALEHVPKKEERKERRPSGWVALEWAALAAVLALILWITFASSLADPFHLSYLYFLPLIWIARRYGLPGTTVGLLATNVGVILAIQHFGLPTGTMVQLQTLLLTLSLAGLFLGGEVTERRRAENALHRSQRRVRAILDAATEAMLMIDPQGTVLAFNPAVEERLGVPSDELLGSDVHDHLPPDLGRSRRARVEEAVHSKEPVHFQDQRGQRRIESNIQPILDEEGEVTSLVIFARDITERERIKAALQRRNRELALLNRAGRAFSSSLELDQVLSTVLEETRTLLDVDSTAIWLIDPESEELICRQATGPRAQELIGWRLAPHTGLAGWVAHHGQSLPIADAHHDPRYREGIERQIGFELRSILTVPLKAKENTIGVLQVVDKKPNRFDHEHLMLAESLAASAASAIENARLYEQAQVEIAERIETEEALRDSEERFHTVFDRAPIGMDIVDLEGQPIEVNQALQRILGYSEEELCSMVFTDYTHQDDVEESLRLVRRLSEEESDHLQMDKRYRRKDGRIVWASVTVSVVRDSNGEPCYYVAMVEDITERKLAQEALQESEKRFRLLYEHAPLPYQSLDEEGRILEVNQAWLDLFGFSRKEDVLGHPFERFVAPDQLEAFEACFAKFKAQGEVYGQEFEIVRKDGIRRVVSFDGRGRLDEKGQFRQSHCIAHDITERKRADEALREQAQRLRTLATRLAEAEEIERRRLSRELHDQIGQNLTALGINLNIIRAQISDELPHPALSRLDESLTLLEQTTERVRDVMADLRPPVLDDYGLLAALHEYGERFASRTGISVHVEGEESDPQLTAQVEGALLRIAQEALTNVAKHAQADHVQLSLSVMNGNIRLVIADDGIGFTPAARPRFGKRNGWGLITMSERAESIGGHLQIESHRGEGTRIIVEVNG